MREEEVKKLKEENKRLKKENEKLRKRLRNRDESIQRYEEISVIKRWKIGEYLHDNLAQNLISAKMSLLFIKDVLTKEKLGKACKEVINILNKSINEVRDLSHDIIPIDVVSEGVGQALRYLVKQQEKQHGIKISLEYDEIVKKINSRKVATNLYNIAQEGIKNAVIHGKAKNIKVVLIEHDQQLYLHIKDDGIGFDPEGEKSGMGITIMKHRAEEIGGRFKIRKAKKGSEFSTVVTCSLPLEALKDD